MVTIGGGLALIVIGAIFADAVNIPNDYVNFAVVGRILMYAGIITFLLGLIVSFRKHNSVTTVRTVGEDGREQVTERRTEQGNYNPQA